MKKQIIIILIIMEFIITGCSVKIDVAGDIKDNLQIDITGFSVPPYTFKIYVERYCDLDDIKNSDIKYIFLSGNLKNTSSNLTMTVEVYVTQNGKATRDSDVFYYDKPQNANETTKIFVVSLAPNESIHLYRDSDNYPQIKEAVKEGKFYVIVGNLVNININFPDLKPLVIDNIYVEATAEKNLNPFAPLINFLY